MRKQSLPSAGPLELAGAGFVFGVATGVFFGLLNAATIWPTICAGAAGVSLSTMARGGPIRLGLRRMKRAFAPRVSRKA